MQKKHIVLVEDEPTLANLIEIGLQKAGYAVQTTGDGKQGLALIEESKPDLVLLDLVLPGLGGFEILEQLQKKRILPGLPVIIISNSGQPVEIDRALKLGVRSYLIKVNFNPQEVMEKVEQVFTGGNYEGEKQKGGKRILIVEDDDILADILARKFVEKKYIADKAFNTQEAKRILGEKSVDLILLDLILPDMNGFIFLREIKADVRLRDIPVIIISNLGQREEVKEGIEEGAVDYIIKANTTPEEIFKKVDGLLNKKSKQKKK